MTVLGAFYLSATILAIGLFLDQVLRPEVKRQIFSRQPRSDPSSNESRWQRIATSILDVNFKGLGFFGYLGVIFIYSFFVFTLVMLVQILLLGFDYSVVLSGSVPLPRLLTALAILLLTAAIVDVASFLQTKILLGLLRSVRNIWEVILLFFAEFFLTINIFILLFAIGLALSLITLTAREWTGDFIATISRDPDAKGDYRDQTSFAEEAYSYLSDKNWQAIVELTEYKDGRLTYTNASTNIFSNFPTTNQELQTVVGLVSGEVGKIYDTELRSGTLQDHTELGVFDHPYDMVGKFIIRTYEGLNHFSEWYTAAYLVTHRIQDEFPGSFMLDPGFSRNWSSAISVYNYLRSEGEFDQGPQAFCKTSNIVPIDFGKLSECQNWLIMDKRILDDFLYSKAFFDGEVGYVPIFTFFYSSLALTLVLYIAFVASWTVRTDADRYRFVGPAGQYFTVESQPFSLLFGFIAVLLFLALTLRALIAAL